MSKPIASCSSLRSATAGALALSALCLAAAGCGNDDVAGPKPCSGSACFDIAMPMVDMAEPPPPPDLAGARNTKFIINRLLLPDPSVPALDFKYDVDGSGRARNQLGLVLSTLKSLGGGDPQLDVDAALEAGQVIQLFQLSSTDPDLFSDSAVALSGWLGSAPGRGGDELFTGKATVDVVTKDQPNPHQMVGAIASGRLTTGYLPPAAMPLRFPLPGQDPVPLTIWGVHVEGPVAMRQAGGFNLGAPGSGRWGVVAGAISATEIRERLIPAVARLLQTYLELGGSTGIAISNFFDTNRDGTISPKELEDNQTVQSLLAPDEDLFDKDGKLAPNRDGERDSLSFGVGFTAVPVSFPDQD